MMYVEFAREILDKVYNDFKKITKDSKKRRNLDMRYEHSLDVFEITKLITESINCEDKELSYLIALWHDLGRFKQIHEHYNFSDARTYDHAKKSIDILDEMKVWDKIPKQWKEPIEFAIFYHNKIILG